MVRYRQYDALGRLGKRVDERFESNLPGERCSSRTIYDYEGLTTDIDLNHAGGKTVGGVGIACRQLTTGVDNYMKRSIGDTGYVYQTLDGNGNPTNYLYDGMGNPVYIQDPNGSVITATYDALGRRSTSTDPNAGESKYVYNGFGEVVRRQNANQIGDPNNTADDTFTETDYDQLGRPVEQRNNVYDGGWFPPATNGKPSVDRWFYDECQDNPDGHCLGLLVREERLDPNQSYQLQHGKTRHYDANGRVVASLSEVSEYPGLAGADTEVFITRYAYDSYFGRVKGMAYPSGDVIYHSYLDDGFEYEQGILFENGNKRAVRKFLARDARGNPIQTHYANGINETAVYHEGSDQPGSMQIAAPGEIIDYLYGYDAYENLQALTQQSTTRPGPMLEGFDYDRLHRLVAADRQYHTDSPINIDYSYDAVGNLIEKSDRFSSYTYDGTATLCGGLSDIGPNQVREAHLSTSAASYQYCYDRAGNMTHRFLVMGGSSTLDMDANYDADNLPTRYTRYTAGASSSLFDYGADHQRYRQYNPEDLNETIYVDKVYERKFGENNVDKTYVGGYMLITRDYLGGAEYHVLHRDRLGSVVAISDRWGNIVEENGYGPFGGVRDETWGNGPFDTLSSDVSTRGFTDHEHVDGLGLIHMNGRAYDPFLGRFLSVDPFIQAPLNSQSLNPYSYIMNNPLSGTDPTGYVSEKCIAKTGSKITKCGGAVATVLSDGKTAVRKGVNTANPASVQDAIAELAGFVTSYVPTPFSNGSDQQSPDNETGGQSGLLGPLNSQTQNLVAQTMFDVRDRALTRMIKSGEITVDEKAELTNECYGADWTCPAFAAATLASAAVPPARIAFIPFRAAPAARMTPKAIGDLGEELVKQVADIGKKALIRINGRGRIPDGLTGTTLSEVKNVARLSYTQQLRDFAAFAGARGLTFDLWVRESTRLTGPLLNAIDRGVIKLKFIPGIP